MRREVLRLAWPVVLQNLFNMMMFMVDTFMIGRVGREAMAAMGVVGPISHGMTSVLGALAVGTVATVARAWGEGDRPKQEREAASALALGILAGLPLSAGGVLFLPALAELFPVEKNPAVTAMARGYLFYQGASLLFLCLFSASSGILRAAGKTHVPMISALAANLVNVLLNWVLIFGHWGAPAMGVAGAGLATALSLVLESLINLAYLFTPRSPIRLGRSAFGGVTAASLGRLARVTLPAAIEPLILQSGWLVYTKAITVLGVGAMAAHRTAITIESLTFMPGYGFAVAGSALVGQCLGAGRPDRAAAALRETALLATFVMSAIGVGFLLAAAPLVRVFFPGPEDVVGPAAACLRISAAEQPFMALAMALGGALRGAGDTRTPVFVGFVGVWVVRIPLAWVLAFPAGLGLYGIWMTMIADWLVRTVIFAAIWRRGRWKAIRL